MAGILARRISAARFSSLSDVRRRSVQWLNKPGTSIFGRSFCSGVLPDTIDRGSEAFLKNSQAMEAIISQLHSNIQKVL